MTEAAHSRNSASKFESEMLCPGRRAMTAGAPRSSSKYAAEGTAAHKLLEWCLLGDKPASAFAGRIIEADGFKFEATDEMVDSVQEALANIRDMAGDAAILAESRVYYDRALDTPRGESFGTADAIVLRGDELQVHDLKYGRGVEVDATDNVQMKLYALGALQLLEDVADTDGIDTVRLVIHQPRIKSAPSEWSMAVRDLEHWGFGEARRAREQADGAVKLRKTLKPREWQAIYLQPSEKACKFCEAKATCPALTEAVLDAVKQAPRASAADPEEFA